MTGAKAKALADFFTNASCLFECASKLAAGGLQARVTVLHRKARQSSRAATQWPQGLVGRDHAVEQEGNVMRSVNRHSEFLPQRFEVFLSGLLAKKPDLIAGEWSNLQE